MRSADDLFSWEGNVEIKRVEYKYLVSAEAAARLEHRFATALQPDPHNGPAGYRVKSLYFDTADDTDYREKNAGLLHRKKLRLRLYDEADARVMLERKEKHGDYQVKTGLPLTPEQAQRLMKGSAEVLLEAGGEGGRALYADMALRRRPVIVVEYLRSAYTWRHANTRLTLDRRIRYSTARHDLFDRELPYQLLDGQDKVVLEVKYDLQLPAFIREMIAPFCGSRLSYGKYERCRGLF